MAWWNTLRGRYEKLIEEYGTAAIVVYFTLFFGTWFSFWLAISFGVDAEGVAAGAGTIGGAWAATKLTQPLRIGATLILTPLAVSAWRRLRPPRATPEPSPPLPRPTEPQSPG